MIHWFTVKSTLVLVHVFTFISQNEICAGVGACPFFAWAFAVSLPSPSQAIQDCAKEMQTKFAEISEITRISAIKLRTFASDEKAAKSRCFYCSVVGEISQAR